jgi:transglutaminase-like putative cysteine protease
LIGEDRVKANYLDADLGVPIHGAAEDIAHELAVSSNLKGIPRAIYDRVLADMYFDANGPGPGHGSTDWAISQGFGDSTDYQAFFISICRASHIPARFQVGYSLPLQKGSGFVSGLHSWAHFYRQGSGWFPLDLAAADLDPGRADYYFGHLSTNRVTLSCGRDILLDPVQAGSPLSFFSHPYAEQGGLDVSLDLDIRFQDLPILTALPSKKELGYWP